eukprot:scaffold135310_cov36-Tisochrysis_lutea.AAC.1
MGCGGAGMASRVVPRLHGSLQPWLAVARPLISPMLESVHRARLDRALNVSDLRECARARAHPMVFGYLDSGADDEIALHRANQ